MCFSNPFRFLSQYLDIIINTINSFRLQVFRSHITFQISYFRIRSQFHQLFANVHAEWNIFHLFLHSHLFHFIYNDSYRFIFRFFGSVRLDFQYQLSTSQFLTRYQIIIQSGQLLAVTQFQIFQFSKRSIKNANSLNAIVMIDYDFLVLRQLYVELRTIHLCLCSLCQRSNRVLGRTFTFPISAVGNHFGLGSPGQSNSTHGKSHH